MAHLWLLLKLRLRLSYRRYSGRPVTLGILCVSLVIFMTLAVGLGVILAYQHQDASRLASDRLFDLTALVVSVFVVIGPLLGFRGNEFMDVSKLFHYPIRPVWVFVSTVLGNFFSGATLFYLPILLVPALGLPRPPAAILRVVLLTLFYLFVLYEAVQCLTLVFLNVLRSRRWRDFIAVLAPIIGMGSYLGVRYLLIGDAGGSPTSISERFLEELDFEPYARFLPPLWYARMIYDGAAWDGVVALLVISIVFCTLGVRLTVRAFHGDIAIQAPAERIRHRRGLLRRLFTLVLPAPAAAVYIKEALVLRREPWFRMLFLQQLGLVVLICLGRGLWDENNKAEDALVWAASFLVFIESGFLLNVLGLEGRAIQQTAALPATCFQILLGKNLAYLQLLGATNLLLVPALAFLSSQLASQPFPFETTVLLVTVTLVVLPVVIGAGNLLSVVLPHPIGRRDRRALGQEQAGGEGCMAIFTRAFFSTLAMLPAAAVGLLMAAPVLFLERRLDWLYFAVFVPAGLLVSAGFYLVLTRPAAGYMQRHLQAILSKLL